VHEMNAEAGSLALAAHLRTRKPDLRHQVAAGKLGQHPGVDPIGLARKHVDHTSGVAGAHRKRPDALQDCARSVVFEHRVEMALVAVGQRGAQSRGPEPRAACHGLFDCAAARDNLNVHELPRGTVTLLFTDVEGSTELQRRLGDDYQEVVAEHRRLLEEAFAAHEGVVVDRQTESFFVAFPRARVAVHAATDAQRALEEHRWPNGVQVKVRMGIHSGDPEVTGDKYVGLAVSRAARICASAHGGQVLLSSSARALLSDHDRSALRNLGPHRLIDFAEAEQISQLVIDDLPSQFPPLRTEAAPSRRKWLLLAFAALLIAGGIAGAVVALTGGGSKAIEVGPTSLAVVDPKSNNVVDALELGFKSSLIAAGEGYVWLVDPGGSTLLKIDPRTHQIVSRLGIAVGAGVIPFGLAVGDSAVWVAVLRGTREVVLQFGPEAGDLRDTFPYGRPAPGPALSALQQPLAVAGGTVWAIDSAAGGTWRIDARSGRTRPLREGLDARSLALGDGAVWVGGSSSLVKLDALTGIELGSTSTASQAFGEIASVAFGGNAVWFASSSGQTLSKLDPETVATTQTYQVGHGPSGIAVGQGGVWVANSRDGTVSRVDPTSGQVRTISVGPAPGGVVAAYGAVWVSPYEPRS
jgi:class 3 adenylate cyclase/streptogramin lyase